MADEYASYSPFAYCLNNPTKYVDPDGKKDRIYYQEASGQIGAVYGAGAFYQFGTARDDYGKTWFQAGNAKLANPNRDGNMVFGAEVELLDFGFINSKNDKSYDSFMSRNFASIGLGLFDLSLNFDAVFGVSGGLGYGWKYNLVESKILKSFSLTRKEAKDVKSLTGLKLNYSHFTIEPFQKYDGNSLIDDPENGILMVATINGYVSTGIKMTKIDEEQWESFLYNYNKTYNKNEKDK